MYDDFSDTYDRFVNWPSRLSFELPFIETQLAQLTSAGQKNGLRLLDAACGTGWHAIALAQRGHRVTGADLSSGMIERAQANALESKVQVHFVTAGFTQLSQTIASGLFDAVLCLGNSLPHLPGPADLREALADFSACLRPGGLLILQNRNFDLVMATRQRWMEPQSHIGSDDEWLFLRFYDFQPDGTIQFNLVNLSRHNMGVWQQRIHSTQLYPLLQNELLAVLNQTGFQAINAFGGMEGEAFDAQHSGNLVICARKQGNVSRET